MEYRLIYLNFYVLIALMVNSDARTYIQFKIFVDNERLREKTIFNNLLAFFSISKDMLPRNWMLQ